MSSSTSPILEVFYDSECAVCDREIKMVQRWDSSGTMRFTDISADGFEADSVGKSQQELMREIHGRLLYSGKPDDQAAEWLIGVDVFRDMYSRLGFRKSVWFSRVPGVSHLLAIGYQVFAFVRYRFALKRMGAKVSRCDQDDSQPPLPTDFRPEVRGLRQ